MKAQAELCLEDLIRHAPGNVTLEQMTAILRQGHEVPFERPFSRYQPMVEDGMQSQLCGCWRGTALLL